MTGSPVETKHFHTYTHGARILKVLETVQKEKYTIFCPYRRLAKMS